MEASHRLIFLLLLGNYICIQSFSSFKRQIFSSLLHHSVSVSRTTTIYSDNLVYEGSRFIRPGNNISYNDASPYVTGSTKLIKRHKVTDFHSEISKVFPSDGLLAFNSDKSIRQNQVDKLIYRHLPEFNQASISALMYRSAKEWKRTKVSVVSRHLLRISNYMSRLPPDQWTAKEISNTLYGIQYMKSDDVRVLKFLSIISNIMLESLCELNENDEEFKEYNEGYDEEDKELDDFLKQPLPFIPTTNRLVSDALIQEEKEIETSPGFLGIDDLIQSSSFELNTIPDEKLLTPRELSTILYALRGMRSDVREVKGFLNVLNRLIFLGRAGRESFDVQGVSNALYGMQGMSSECSEVRALVTQLSLIIARSDDNLDGQAIGNSLYGLKSMNSEHPEVRMLLRVLAMKINSSSAEMKAQEMANALYGLQGMSSDHVEVKEILLALEKKIISSRSNQIFNAQEIGNALYGLQKMKSECPEVRNLILALRKKMSNTNVIMNAQSVGSAFIGLQGMNSDHFEVRKLLSTLTKHIKNCDVLDEQAIGSIIGLQRMNERSVEVRDLLNICSKKLEFCQGRLSKEEITNFLFGLQNMIVDDECEEVSTILSTLNRQIKRSVYISCHSHNNDNIIDDTLSRAVENVIKSIKSVKKMCGRNTHFGIQEIMSLLIIAEYS